jgi:hypothetical protein
MYRGQRGAYIESVDTAAPAAMSFSAMSSDGRAQCGEEWRGPAHVRVVDERAARRALQKRVDALGLAVLHRGEQHGAAHVVRPVHHRLTVFEQPTHGICIILGRGDVQRRAFRRAPPGHASFADYRGCHIFFFCCFGFILF